MSGRCVVDAPKWHCEQDTANGCVPAVISMLLKAGGRPVLNEAELASRASARGHNLSQLAIKHGFETRAFNAQELVDHLPLIAASTGLFAATVCGPRYVQLCGTRPAGHASQHGDLATPGAFGPPIHAIVVQVNFDDQIAVFDPYYPAAGQPIAMTVEQFLEMFAGEIVW